MGCCTSIPHSQRRYRDPADLDEEIVPLREFGNFRNGTTNLVPDDVSTCVWDCVFFSSYLQIQHEP